MFIACIMLKYDSNLGETREKIVPGMVSEDEFWRNYFYAIECIKQEMGLPTRLGDRVDQKEKEKRIQIEETKL